MLIGNLLIVFAIMGIIATLLIIQFILAARYDHEISAAPRYKTLDVLDEEIQLKKDVTADLEAELDKRRQALAVMADLHQEVEILDKKRDELEVEWGQLGDRRNEIHLVRTEMEKVINEKLNADSDLVEVRMEWESIKERTAEAEQLLTKIEDMKQEHDTLKSVIDKHQEEARELVKSKEVLDNLNRQTEQLREMITSYETEISGATQRVDDIHARADAERMGLVAAQSEHTEIAAKNATAHQNALELEASCAALEARHARLEEETGVTTVDSEAEVTERLKELRSSPPVLKNIQHWRTTLSSSESDALNGVFTRLESSGLEYHRRTIYAFHTAMKVNETTQMAILSGISGTGKSQLPRQYALGMGIGFLQVPVQPRWDSPQDLMGFYNYIEKRFRPTDMARALYQLDTINNPESEFHDRMMMILLDEMNLARVEYYFSDFLSRLESRPPADQISNANLRKDAEIELEIPMPRGIEAPRIFPGYNLLFAGTMNEDESTQSLSDKVVDRANILRFAAPKRIHSGNTHTGNPMDPQALTKAQWDRWIQKEVDSHNPRVNDALDRMVQIMKDLKRPFGHRLGRAISVYVANYPMIEGGDQVLDPLADQIEMRLLPKLRGTEIDQAEQAFDALIEFVSQNLGDEVLAHAIRDSVDTARDGGTGQFVWNGVTR
jgi:hypothetical protein